jgi:hypothetical protein
MIMSLIVKQYNDQAYSVYKDFEETLRSKKFHHLGEGSYRRGWQRKNVVIKVPKCEVGYCDNILEAYAYRKYRKGPDYNDVVYAPCRLLPNGALLMTFVEFVEYKQLPVWCGYIDGMQCGNYHGRIVAYDAASDIIGKDRSDAMKWGHVMGSMDHCECLVVRSDCNWPWHQDPIRNPSNEEPEARGHSLNKQRE